MDNRDDIDIPSGWGGMSIAEKFDLFSDQFSSAIKPSDIVLLGEEGFRDPRGNFGVPCVQKIEGDHLTICVFGQLVCSTGTQYTHSLESSTDNVILWVSSYREQFANYFTRMGCRRIHSYKYGTEGPAGYGLMQEEMEYRMAIEAAFRFKETGARK